MSKKEIMEGKCNRNTESECTCGSWVLEWEIMQWWEIVRKT